MTPTEPPWLTIGRKYIGVRETAGKDTTPTIAKWLLNLKAWWRDDETPWCGVFVAECMKEANMPVPPAWYRAKAWLEWGAPIFEPIVGCVVVFSRVGGGHVGFVVGRAKDGRLMVLGGNQGNQVGVAPFAPDRIVGFRWPVSMTARLTPLPVVDANGVPTSRNEA